MRIFNWITVLLLLIGVPGAAAQTMSFEQAATILLNSCGKDIDKNCRNVNVGSGKMKTCLLQNPGVSAACKTDWNRVAAAVQQRAQARVAVLKICDPDARRLCGAVEKGDGQLLECMLAAKQGVSAKCNQAITDAGYR